mgnify:CR=1 FL=1
MAKVLSERERKYAQVKREVWRIVMVVITGRDYLIKAKVVIETNCLPILDMIFECSILDIATLHWMAYMKSLNSEVRHVSRKDKALANTLSRTSCQEKIEELVDHEEELDVMDTPTMDYEGAWTMGRGYNRYSYEHGTGSDEDKNSGRWE